MLVDFVERFPAIVGMVGAHDVVAYATRQSSKPILFYFTIFDSLVSIIIAKGLDPHIEYDFCANIYKSIPFAGD
jgi:hypothetical protein